MRIGELRDQVRFERRVDAANVGGVVRASSWSPIFAAVRAKVFPLRGGEGVQAARLDGRDVYEVTVRGTSATRAVTRDDRAVIIVHTPEGPQETTLAIRSIANPDRRGEWLQFLCDTASADGD